MNPAPLLVYCLGRTTSYQSATLILIGLSFLPSILLVHWFGGRAEQQSTEAPNVLWILAILRTGWGPLVAPSAFADVVRREGRMAIPFRVKVHAPYHRIRTGGSLGTLVLDGQGTVHDAAALDSILAGRAPRS